MPNFPKSRAPVSDPATRELLGAALLDQARAAVQALHSGQGEALYNRLADLLAVVDRVALTQRLDGKVLQARRAARLLAQAGLDPRQPPPPSLWGAPRLYDGLQRPLLGALREHLARCQGAYLAVAFILDSGLKLLENTLAAALARGASIRLLTTDYLDITEPEALERLLALPGDLEVHLYREPGRSYHPKAYLFDHGGQEDLQGVAFVGSANLSRSALQGGVEWTYTIRADDPGWPLGELLGHFHGLFDSPHSEVLTPAWLSDYRARRQPKSLTKLDRQTAAFAPPTPRPAQVEALNQLEALRAEGERRGLVVAATGLGKTYLAAFDSRIFGRVLFVAHRRELLEQAERSFRQVRPWNRTGFYDGQQQPPGAELLFASIQTLGRREHLERFDPEQFDYLVVDEFHHAAMACLSATSPVSFSPTSTSTIWTISSRKLAGCGPICATSTIWCCWATISRNSGPCGARSKPSWPVSA